MHEPLPEHLAAIAARRDVARLLGMVSGADRTHPVAREWVRRWRPVGDAPELPGEPFV